MIFVGVAAGKSLGQTHAAALAHGVKHAQVADAALFNCVRTMASRRVKRIALRMESMAGESSPQRTPRNTEELKTAFRCAPL